MSSINSKVPPPRLSAVDTPTDGQIPSYQASSGEFEWVDDTSNSPGGSDTQVQFNDGGSFGGDDGFTYTKATEKVKVGNATIETSNAGKVSVVQESADTGAAMYLQKDEDGAGSGPNLVFYRNSTTPANDDALGRLGFNGEDSIGGERTYARVTGEIEDVSSGANDGRIVVETIKAGVQTEQMKIDSAGIKFNDAYTFPTADGNANEVLQTDGAGALSFAVVSGQSWGELPQSWVSNTRFSLTDGGTFGVGPNTSVSTTLAFTDSAYGAIFQAPATGQLTEFGLNFSNAGGYEFGIYDTDSNNHPSGLVAKGGITSTGSGVFYQTNLTGSGGGDAGSITAGEIYWLLWVRDGTRATVSCIDTQNRIRSVPVTAANSSQGVIIKNPNYTESTGLPDSFSITGMVQDNDRMPKLFIKVG